VLLSSRISGHIIHRLFFSNRMKNLSLSTEAVRESTDSEMCTDSEGKEVTSELSLVRFILVQA
jgi:hypothetical protein